MKVSDFPYAAPTAVSKIPMAGETHCTPQDLKTFVNAGQPKVYRALLTQSGESAPTATVLQDDFGTLTWNRVGVGVYTLNGSVSQTFPVARRAVTTEGAVSFWNAEGVSLGVSSWYKTPFTTYVALTTTLFWGTAASGTLSSGYPVDGVLTSSPFEVKVY